VLAARWVGYPWPENRGRNWSRKVRATRSSSSQTAACARRDRKQAFLSTDHCSPATRHHHHPFPPAGNWVRFACLIPPWFVLNCDMAMTKTKANWLRFGAFRPAPTPLFGFTDDSSLSSRRTPHAARLMPPLLCIGLDVCRLSQDGVPGDSRWSSS
jgi:hypothetical protein